jgi:hypothetical protein
MSQAADPRAALKSKDVTVRAAAARELARNGTWDDLSTLVEMAKSDKSPSVRLYTAAAASDIAARFRGAAGQKRMTPQQATEVQDWVKRMDPVINPSLLMMLSAVGDAASIKRLGRMLRDPRGGVRSGAATALRRMAVSAAAVGDTQLPEFVRGWLESKKLTPDVTLELLKLSGEVGWTGLEDVQRLASVSGRPHGPAYDEVQTRKVARADLQTWQGLWCSDGVDALCAPIDDCVDPWIAIRDGQAISSQGQTTDFELDGDVGVAGERFRLIWTDRVGEGAERVAALQGGGVTYYKAEDKVLVKTVDSLGSDLGAAGLWVAEWLAEIDGSLATRARAIALWAGGALDESLAILTTQTGHMRPRNDLFYWLARVQVDLGEQAKAREAILRFLDKAGQKAPLRAAGEALRDALS